MPALVLAEVDYFVRENRPSSSDVSIDHLLQDQDRGQDHLDGVGRRVGLLSSPRTDGWLGSARAWHTCLSSRV